MLDAKQHEIAQQARISIRRLRQIERYEAVPTKEKAASLNRVFRKLASSQRNSDLANGGLGRHGPRRSRVRA